MLSHIRIPRLVDPQPLRHKPSTFAVDAAEANPVDTNREDSQSEKGREKNHHFGDDTSSGGPHSVGLGAANPFLL